MLYPNKSTINKETICVTDTNTENCQKRKHSKEEKNNPMYFNMGI